jgi:hypothetical protein
MSKIHSIQKKKNGEESQPSGTVILVLNILYYRRRPDGMQLYWLWPVLSGKPDMSLLSIYYEIREFKITSHIEYVVVIGASAKFNNAKINTLLFSCCNIQFVYFLTWDIFPQN